MSTDSGPHHANNDADSEVTDGDGSALDRAAAQGPLEGVAAEDAAEQRGEDHSGDNEPTSSGGLLSNLLPHDSRTTDLSSR